ncbi:MAG: hypothetical protein ACRC7N_03285 [Clostridium sp.]
MEKNINYYIEELRKKDEIINNNIDLKIYEAMKYQTNQLIDENKQLKKQLLKSEKELKNIISKYEALKSSKLGKITLRYWDIKRKKK